MTSQPTNISRSSGSELVSKPSSKGTAEVSSSSSSCSSISRVFFSPPVVEGRRTAHTRPLLSDLDSVHHACFPVGGFAGLPAFHLEA
eukprot:1177886-Prorocentrum_minimum.AAC.2